MHAGSLTAKQRTALLDSARTTYQAQLEEAKNATKTADGPYAKAVAEFAQAQAKAALKLLDSIPQA